MRRAGVGLSLARIALRATMRRENGRRLLLTISRSSRSRVAASSSVKSINSSTRSFTALFLGTLPSEAGFARYGAQPTPPHRGSGTPSFHGRGFRLRPVPEPLGIDIDSRRNHPVDLPRDRELVARIMWVQPIFCGRSSLCLGLTVLCQPCFLGTGRGRLLGRPHHSSIGQCQARRIFRWSALRCPGVIESISRSARPMLSLGAMAVDRAL